MAHITYTTIKGNQRTLELSHAIAPRTYKSKGNCYAYRIEESGTLTCINPVDGYERAAGDNVHEYGTRELDKDMQRSELPPEQSGTVTLTDQQLRKLVSHVGKLLAMKIGEELDEMDYSILKIDAELAIKAQREAGVEVISEEKIARILQAMRPGDKA